MARLSKNNKRLHPQEPFASQERVSRGLAWTKRCDDCLGKFFRARLAAHVLSDVLTLAVHSFEGAFDAPSGRPFAEVVQHHDAAQKKGRWIRQPFSGDVGRGSMYGLEHGGFIAIVGGAYHAETAD